jgi:hypothetical protein
MCFLENQKYDIINQNLETLISSFNDGFGDINYAQKYINFLANEDNDNINRKIKTIENIISKRKKKKKKFNNSKCLARIWNDGKGGQCSRKKKCNGFCLGHWKKYQNNSLPHGRIDEKEKEDFLENNRIIDGNLITYQDSYYVLDLITNNVYSYHGNNRFVGVMVSGSIDFEVSNPYHEYDTDDSDLE